MLLAVSAVASHIQKVAQPLARCEWEAFSWEGDPSYQFLHNLNSISLRTIVFVAHMVVKMTFQKWKRKKLRQHPILQMFELSQAKKKKRCSGFLLVYKMLGTVVLLLGPWRQWGKTVGGHFSFILMLLKQGSEQQKSAWLSVMEKDKQWRREKRTRLLCFSPLPLQSKENNILFFYS